MLKYEIYSSLIKYNIRIINVKITIVNEKFVFLQTK